MSIARLGKNGWIIQITEHDDRDDSGAHQVWKCSEEQEIKRYAVKVGMIREEAEYNCIFTGRAEGRQDAEGREGE